MKHRPLLIALLALLAAGLLAGWIAANLRLARIVPGGRELVAPWQAGRAVWAGFVAENIDWLRPVILALPDGSSRLERMERGLLAGPTDPYDGRVAAAAQREVYRRPAADGEYPFQADYPLYLIALMMPLGFFEDFTTLRGVWLAFSGPALLVVVFLSLRMAGWQSSRLVTGLVFLGAALSFPGVYPLLAGSPSIWLLLAFFGVFLSLRAGQDELAGGLLVLTAFKWEITGMAFILLTVWVISQRRWRVGAGLLMTLAVLVALSTIFSPGWGFLFLKASVENLRAEWGLTTWEAFPRPWPGWLLSALLAVLLAAEFRVARDQGFHHLFWSLSLALAVTPLMGWRVLPADYAILLPALAVICRVSDDRWGRLAGLLPLAVLLAAWWVLGGMMALGADHPRAGWFLALPGSLLVAMYWLRWWALAPPRTWFDRVKEGRLDDLA